MDGVIETGFGYSSNLSPCELPWTPNGIMEECTTSDFEVITSILEIDTLYDKRKMVLLLLIMIENGEMIYIKNIISKRCFMKKWLTVCLFVVMIMLVACSSTDDSGDSEDKQSSDDQKTIAFSAGASNNYLQTGIKEAEKVAKEYGWKIEIFDGGFDPLNQLNQLQNAVAQKI